MEVPLLEVYKLDQTTITSNAPQRTNETQELCPAITTLYKTAKEYSFGSVKYKPKNGLRHFFPFLDFV